MKFAVKPADLGKVNNAAVVVGIFETGELSPAAAALDKSSQGVITKLVKRGDIQGKPGETLLLQHLPGTKAGQVLLVGCGKVKPVLPQTFRKMVANSISTLHHTSLEQVIFLITEVPVEGHDNAWKVKQGVEVCYDKTYRFTNFKSDKGPKLSLKEIIFGVADKAALKSCEKSLAQAMVIAESVKFTKDLENLPSNICTPPYMAEFAKKFAQPYKNISVKVLTQKDMEKLGMGAFLAVAQGSAHPPQLICLEYKNGGKKAPIALVGKGITFDTGGNSIKPADAMVGMKYDMCGAASVLGTLKAAADLKLPINVVGLLAVAENMPGGTACKPEDIVTTMSGQTVEIMNTDAEGRLVLCDALTYCERYKPEVVIDIATLTGAVVIALGYHASGLLSNNDDLARDLLKAGNESFDRAWQMPLWDEYQDQLKSPFADMSNVGGRAGGTITAACFLSRFTKKFKWAHLDVAGTAAMMSGNDRFATGRPVPLLVQYLINQSK